MGRVWFYIALLSLYERTEGVELGWLDGVSSGKVRRAENGRGERCHAPGGCSGVG